MTIRFAIQPELDLLLYVFEGEYTVADYFAIYEAAYRDPRRHHGMRVIFDLHLGTPEFTPADFGRLVGLVKANQAAGYNPDHVALVSAGSSLVTFCDTLKAMADDVPLYLEPFHSQNQALNWLGLEDHEAEVMSFWEALRQECA